MTDKLIHVVFKTHLDIGFTDHAAKVRAQYHERFIPQAIETGEHFYAENPEVPQFIWTTGAWLIWDHLQTQSPERVARLERAIKRGLIAWHALPFTTHTELMSPALFKAGLSISGELDRRFGRKTIAAKMTDVPGHTLGMVPLLAEAGVRFLHLGVNTASPVPDVPDVFRWRAPGGDEIVVMYQKSYGETHFPDGFAEGLSFAHTADNIGPQSVSQAQEALREIRAHNAGAVLRAATLDDYGALTWARREEFPVIDIEIGDSWIHGAGSDPQKLARFLALQRVFDGFAADGLTDERLAFGRGLAMVAEHTWGVDIKSFLRDETAWDRVDFEAARKTDYRFGYAEASWAEQRDYLDVAVAALGEADRGVAGAALAAVPTEEPVAAAGDLASLHVGGWIVGFDPMSGDLTGIVAPDGAAVTGRAGSLLGYRYESYGAADVARHMDGYLMHRLEWAILDHDRPGLGRAKTAISKAWMPRLVGVAQHADFAVLRLAMAEEAVSLLGAPAVVEVRLRAVTDGLEIGVVMRGKAANRMPEASFVTLTPEGASAWDYRKMGLWQAGEAIATRGGGQLQAVTGVRARVGDVGLEVVPLDTPLVAPAGSDFMAFAKGVPDLTAGVRFNLHNNKWGTNFPMWWEGDLLARFVVRLA